MQLTAIVKLGLLLSIKESYLLVKNAFGLVWHPVKTLSSLSREKDRSQQLLVIGLPLWILVVGVGFTWLGRRLLATTPEWGMGAKLVFATAIIAAVILTSYLSYWLIKIYRYRHD